MTVMIPKPDRYEKGIIEALTARLDGDVKAAMAIFEAYRPVLDALDRYDHHADYAERFHMASQNGLKPDIWLKRIRRVEREERRDQLKKGSSGIHGGIPKP